MKMAMRVALNGSVVGRRRAQSRHWGLYSEMHNILVSPRSGHFGLPPQTPHKIVHLFTPIGCCHCARGLARYQIHASVPNPHAIGLAL